MAFCVFVTPEGFEPPTNRTGICHSIQLNYGVGNGGKCRKKMLPHSAAMRLRNP